MFIIKQEGCGLYKLIAKNAIKGEFLCCQVLKVNFH
jgi:hypothetical protein